VRKPPARRTLLLVEDDIDVRETMVDVLTSARHHVVSAVNGADALKKIAGIERPCLIILDLMMPDMDGFEFLERLKDHPHAPEFPVLVVSAHDALARAARYPGVLGTLRKPFDVEELLAWVNEHC
jgi:CheY-like chemotaxis protein